MLDGACRLDKLVDRALELEFPALAITDHGVMHGVIDFYQQAKAKNLKPIIGCEVYIAPNSRFERKANSRTGMSNTKTSGGSLNNISQISDEMSYGLLLNALYLGGYKSEWWKYQHGQHFLN